MNQRRSCPQDGIRGNPRTSAPNDGMLREKNLGMEAPKVAFQGKGV